MQDDSGFTTEVGMGGDDGSTLQTGWMVGVGFDNFLRLFTDGDVAGPLASVALWTFSRSWPRTEPST
ncbi:MAG TPA: hypothetical protein PKE40_05505 [Arachnia sp.]|nr:hypothetical protein [Arachnia sp.]HMT85792.1 hypothetical protein [Arachnia sp.]